MQVLLLYYQSEKWLVQPRAQQNKPQNESGISTEINAHVVVHAFLRWPVPGFSHLFPKYFSLISSFFLEKISQLFPVYFTVISHFSIISHLFLKYFPVISHFPTMLLISQLHFPTISQLFPSESPDISAIR